MRYQTDVQGANAIVACDLDYETMNAMLMVSTSGTAVKIEPESDASAQAANQPSVGRN